MRKASEPQPLGANPDVIVVGAGPAGAAAAISSARLGLRVLLVDAKPFPRRKVCGGCLNQVSLELAQRLLGPEHPLWQDSPTLDQYRLLHRGRQFVYKTPVGVAVDRAALDLALVRQAEAEGVVFRDNCTAKLAAGNMPEQQAVELESAGSREQISAPAIVFAGGLGGLRQAEATHAPHSAASTDSQPFKQVADARSRVGIEAIYAHFPEAYTAGAIHMVVGRNGYVGLTQIADRRLHVAAAVDRSALQQLGPEPLVQQILAEAGAAPLPDCEGLAWRGTPPLTARAHKLALGRVFLVGDAAGYVEPFTGEGIRWALESGIGVASILPRTGEPNGAGRDLAWDAWYRQHILIEQRLCRHLSTGLKQAFVRSLAHRVLCLQPRLAMPIIARLNRKKNA